MARPPEVAAGSRETSGRLIAVEVPGEVRRQRLHIAASQAEGVRDQSGMFQDLVLEG